jgi:hypothetical protein
MSAQPPELGRLAGPPRPLPAALAARVRLNTLFVVGVAWLGLSGLGLIAALRHSPLPGEWYLLWDRREAPGWLQGVQKHQSQGKQGAANISFTYRYNFQLPDGRHLTGESSSGSELFRPPRRPKPGRPPDVTVEYHPRHVEANRIKGTRSASGGAFIVFGLLVPAVGLVLTALGLWSGWRENRLLRHGLPSDGYIQTCRLPSKSSRGRAAAGGMTVTWSSSGGEPEQPLDEFRDRIWAEHRAALDTARRVRENRIARGCGWTLAFAFALFFGGGMGAVVLGLLALLASLALGWRAAANSGPS